MAAISDNFNLPALQLPRVYPILDTATLERLGLSATTAAEALLEGGARILQLRHKGFWSREILAQAERIAALCRSADALFVVNDRADYAMLLHAAAHPKPIPACHRTQITQAGRSRVQVLRSISRA